MAKFGDVYYKVGAVGFSGRCLWHWFPRRFLRHLLPGIAIGEPFIVSKYTRPIDLHRYQFGFVGVGLFGRNVWLANDSIWGKLLGALMRPQKGEICSRESNSC